MRASYRNGAMLQDGVVHRPGKCPKFYEEDDHVIRVMCGEWVYHPTIPCTCTEEPDPVEVAAAQGGFSHFGCD